ncbi:MFS transporter [Pseudomonas sp. PDM23]|uniref:MFS transporter n=1 Tax=unclassified Pseudomonas TaxID=196821 RepID=UPI001783E5CC|nr:MULTISPECIES: MFS transporter [unclassified Pseudomonas]MBD9579192.1 MFS transporter [Pseudomonas sp. PDM23]MBD9672822.1 MFS transporter [Pseudomonas sp. PDM21]
MESPGFEPTDRQRWGVLARINTSSALSQIVQIGTITPLLSLSMERQGVDPARIGLVVSASWLAILVLYRLVPRLLVLFGLARASIISAALTVVAVLGMSLTREPMLLFMLNFVLGIGLILRWIASDTWIVLVAQRSERGRAIGIHETLMGLGIAVGPLLLSLLGVESSTPYFACAALAGVSGVVAWTLRDVAVAPGIPMDKKPRGVLGIIPLALCGAFIAGFSETSSITFLASYGLAAGYLLATATLLVATFGAGGTALQLPIGWVADRSSYRAAQLLCGLVLVGGAMLIALCLPYPWLAALAAFVWGGAIGGMNTLAVIEAGERVGEQQLSTAMTAIALFYTLGSIAGPIITGVVIGALGEQGLVASVGAVGLLFVLALALYPGSSPRQ